MDVTITITTPYLHLVWGLVPGMRATITAQGIGKDLGRIQVLLRNLKGSGYDPVWFDSHEFEIIPNSYEPAFLETEFWLNQRNHYEKF